MFFVIWMSRGTRPFFSRLWFLFLMKFHELPKEINGLLDNGNIGLGFSKNQNETRTEKKRL